MFRLGCRRYWKIWRAQEVRGITAWETRFIENHKKRCTTCAGEEQAELQSIALLRNSVIEPDVSSGFDQRVIRAYRVQSKRATLAYWSPAIVGAAVAAVAILATLQLISQSDEIHLANMSGTNSEARNTSKPVLPDWSIKGEFKLDR